MTENQGWAGPLDIEALEMSIRENHFLNEPKALAILARIRELERLRPSLPQGSPAGLDLSKEIEALRSYIARSSPYYVDKANTEPEGYLEMAEWGLSRIQHLLGTPRTAPADASAPLGPAARRVPTTIYRNTQGHRCATCDGTHEHVHGYDDKGEVPGHYDGSAWVTTPSGAEGSVLREAVERVERMRDEAGESLEAARLNGLQASIIASKFELSALGRCLQILRDLEHKTAPRPQEDGPSPATPQAPDLRDSFDAFKERHLSENSYSTDVEPIVIQAMWETWLAATPKPTGAAAPGSQGGLPNAG